MLASLWQKIKNLFKSPPKQTTPVYTPPVVVVPEPSLPAPIPSNTEYPWNPKPNRDPNKPVIVVDVYWGDNITNWKTLGEYADAIIIKASEGVTRKDPKFDEFRKKAKENGLLVGFYHFYRTNKDPIAQADWFCSIVKALVPGDLCVVCDYETEDDAADGFDILEVEQFNLRVETKLRMTPWVYSGHIIKQAGAKFKVPERFARYFLWIAHYTKGAPVVPAPWSTSNIFLHQFTEEAVVPGISNPKGTDLNKFNGTYKDLLNLCYKG